jgi:hypothetical protein
VDALEQQVCDARARRNNKKGRKPNYRWYCGPGADRKRVKELQRGAGAWLPWKLNTRWNVACELLGLQEDAHQGACPYGDGERGAVVWQRDPRAAQQQANSAKRSSHRIKEVLDIYRAELDMAAVAEEVFGARDSGKAVCEAEADSEERGRGRRVGGKERKAHKGPKQHLAGWLHRPSWLENPRVYPGVSGPAAHTLATLRAQFWSAFAHDILDDHHCKFFVHCVRETPISGAATHRFLARLKEVGSRAVVQARWHGTSLSNYDSIYRHGLAVPGTIPGVVVRNGSAHGVGIYTAQSPWTSVTYAHGSGRLLLCAVINDAQGIAFPDWLTSGDVAPHYAVDREFSQLMQQQYGGADAGVRRPNSGRVEGEDGTQPGVRGRAAAKARRRQVASGQAAGRTYLQRHHKISGSPGTLVDWRWSGAMAAVKAA